MSEKQRHPLEQNLEALKGALDSSSASPQIVALLEAIKEASDTLETDIDMFVLLRMHEICGEIHDEICQLILIKKQGDPLYLLAGDTVSETRHQLDLALQREQCHKVLREFEEEKQMPAAEALTQLRNYTDALEYALQHGSATLKILNEKCHAIEISSKLVSEKFSQQHQGLDPALVEDAVRTLHRIVEIAEKYMIPNRDPNDQKWNKRLSAMVEDATAHLGHPGMASGIAHSSQGEPSE